MSSVLTRAAPSRLSRTPDDQLVRRAGQGDQAAFSELHDRHAPKLLGFARGITGSEADAEDAVQHALIAAFGQIADGTRPDHLGAWLHTIVRNRCLSVLRARRPQSELPESLASHDRADAVAEARDDLQAVLGDLGRLPEQQRAALLLASFGDLDHAAIADVLQVRQPQVKALVFQARETLAGLRTARAADCREIRQELAVARGGQLRRGPLRRHLAQCAGCSDFQAQVAHQQVALRSLIPVAGGVGLKVAVLGSLGTGAGASALGGGGAGAVGSVAAAAGGSTAAGGVASGGLAAAAGVGLTTKAAGLLAAAGLAAGGYAAARPDTAPSATTPQARAVAVKPGSSSAPRGPSGPPKRTASATAAPVALTSTGTAPQAPAGRGDAAARRRGAQARADRRAAAKRQERRQAARKAQRARAKQEAAREARADARQAQRAAAEAKRADRQARKAQAQAERKAQKAARKAARKAEDRAAAKRARKAERKAAHKARKAREKAARAAAKAQEQAAEAQQAAAQAQQAVTAAQPSQLTVSPGGPNAPTGPSTPRPGETNAQQAVAQGGRAQP